MVEWTRFSGQWRALIPCLDGAVSLEGIPDDRCRGVRADVLGLFPVTSTLPPVRSVVLTLERRGAQRLAGLRRFQVWPG
jgi:hypothetical protein